MNFVKKFDSGLTLIAEYMPQRYSVSLGVMVNVGSIRETPEVNGYSHFIEHLNFKGTKRFTAAEISERISDVGGVMNAYTSKDLTCFYTQSEAGALETCVDLLADLYFNSTYDEGEIEKEKTVVIEEIKMGLDMPEDVCQDLLFEAAYKDQKLGQTIIGSAENIEHSDRNSILKYREKYYVGNNTIISVAGNFDTEKLVSMIEKYFESNFKRSAVVEEEETSKHSAEFLTQFKDVEQAHVALAFPAATFSDQEETVKFSLFSSIFGGESSSRLFKTIREDHGLAYSVYSYYSRYKNSGFLEIYCGCSPKNVKKVAQDIQNEMRKAATEGFTQKELDRAKAVAVNSAYMAFDNTMNVMLSNGKTFAKLGRAYDLEGFVDQVKGVSLEQVNEVARRCLSSPFAASYVGKNVPDHKEITKISLKN